MEIPQDDPLSTLRTGSRRVVSARAGHLGSSCPFRQELYLIIPVRNAIRSGALADEDSDVVTSRLHVGRRGVECSAAKIVLSTWVSLLPLLS